MEESKKDERVSMVYLPMGGQSQSITHYTCKGGTHGYVTLRRCRREAAEVVRIHTDGAEAEYAPAMT